MPCVRPIKHRRFLSHFPPGSMRCRFNPELVIPLPHAMMNVFTRSESKTTCGPATSPLSPLTPTASLPQLVPKPPGEVSRVGRGGYTLKDVLEGQHGWEDGLYDQIRVCYSLLCYCHLYCHLRRFSGKGTLVGRRIFGHVPCLFRSSQE